MYEVNKNACYVYIGFVERTANTQTCLNKTDGEYRIQKSVLYVYVGYYGE